MRQGRRKHDVPGLNTTSTSDISFMLLIFFLVTTSMDSDKGLSRRLPPEVPIELRGNLDVDRNMVITLHLDEKGKLTVGEKAISNGADLRKEVSRFIAEKGPQHIIELQVDRKADYDSYFRVQNLLSRTYTELRRSAARQRYNKPLERLNEDEQRKIMEAYPQRIQEVVNY